jgi:hypothetical protein
MSSPTSISVGAKVVGQRQRVFDDWRVPIPPERDGERRTLRELISLIVVHEVEAFRARQEERKLARVLSPAQIAEGAARGKVDAGASEVGVQEVNDEAAVATALQAFEDGLYFVFIDDVQQTDLDATVYVGEGSRLMFVRLVALIGG